MIRVERVEPGPFAEMAGRILQESWRPPCLRYTPDYLRWQFGFPGESSPIGVAAFDGEEPIGFAATSPRRLRSGRLSVEAYVLSFVAIRPGWRGRGLGETIYKALLGPVGEAGRPVVAFAEPESAGRRLLLRSFEAAGYRSRPLGTYRSHGCLVRAGVAPPAACRTGPDDEAGFLAVVGRCNNPATLWNDPDEGRLSHYRRDPRGRALVVVAGPGGDPIGAAMTVRSEVLTAQGVERVPMVDGLFLPAPSAEALRAVFLAAGERWGSGGSSAVVTAPNVWGIDAAILKSAGLRASPSSFEGYLFTREGDGSLPDAEGTNLEII